MSSNNEYYHSTIRDENVINKSIFLNHSLLDVCLLDVGIKYAFMLNVNIMQVIMLLHCFDS